MTLLRLFVIAAVALSTVVVPVAASAVSSNNDIANAIDITSLPWTYHQTNSGDDLETDEDAGGSCGIEDGTSWYTYTPASNQDLVLDTGAGWSATSVAVYTGGPVIADLTEVACSKSGLVAFSMTSGTTYWIQVSGYDGSDSETLYADVLLDGAATIEGTVSHASDGALSGITVHVHRDGKARRSGSAVTDGSGAYSFTVPAGDWDLRFLDFTDTYATEWYSDAYNQGTATPVSVAVGATAVADEELVTAATVAGTIRDAYSGAVITTETEGEFATVVNVLDETLSFSGEISGGMFEVVGVPPGTYALETGAADPYGRAWSDGVSTNEQTLADAPSFTLAAGEDATQDALLTPKSITGTVTDEKSGDPLKGITVEFYNAEGEELLGSTTTDIAGTYLWLHTTGASEIVVLFSDEDGLYATEWHDDVPDMASAATILLNGGEVEMVNAVLTPVSVAPVVTNQAFEVNDGSGSGTVVGTVAASDANTADTLTWTITAGNGSGTFTIDPSTGKLTLAAGVDAATKDTYALTVKVADDNAPALSDTATVTVTVASAPVLGNRTVSVSELADVGTTVVDLDGTDLNGDALTYSITSGNGADKFAIHATTGKITIAKSLDYETTSSYVLTVKVSDGARSDTAKVTVKVTDKNETAPSAGFTDTADSIFEADIDWLAWVGVTKGCNPPVNDEFCPHDFVTRGQMAAFLDRALGLDDGAATFDDTEGHTFEANIAALAQAGITKGCNPPVNDEFCPDDLVTRGQMAAFLKRALEGTIYGP